METITTNIAARARRETKYGHNFLVAPVTLLVPGVLNGSKGPLFYPQAEVCASADAWNGVPLTVGHPFQLGQHVSAQTPGIVERQGIGQIRNARCANGRLKAEGWFNTDALGRIAPELLRRLERGEPVEVSTGLFTENQPSTGIHNGREYTHVARNYKPDHLAILPDEVGACSMRDGCGVFIDNQNDRDDYLPLPPPLVEVEPAADDLLRHPDPELLVPPRIDFGHRPSQPSPADDRDDYLPIPSIDWQAEARRNS